MNRALYDLQEADNRLTSLHRERNKLDDGTSTRTERDTLQRACAVEAQKLDALQAQRAAKEDELKTTETKIAKQQARLMNVSSAHEISALQRDVTGLNHARSDLDEAVLTLMDETESGARRVSELQAQLAAKQAQLQEVERHFRIESARIEAEMNTAREERSRLAGEIEPAALQKYETVAKRHGVAVAHIEKGNCSACGMTITPYNLREAKAAQWPTCESCGRLLFIE